MVDLEALRATSFQHLARAHLLNDHLVASQLQVGGVEPLDRKRVDRHIVVERVEPDRLEVVDDPVQLGTLLLGQRSVTPVHLLEHNRAGVHAAEHRDEIVDVHLVIVNEPLAARLRSLQLRIGHDMHGEA